MAILCPRTTDTVQVCHMADPDVDASNVPGYERWIPTDRARKLSPGASVLVVGPLDNYEATMASGNMVTGERIWQAIVRSVRKIGSWVDEAGSKRLKLVDADLATVDRLLRQADCGHALMLQLFRFVDALTAGQDPLQYGDPPKEDTPDPPA